MELITNNLVLGKIKGIAISSILLFTLPIFPDILGVWIAVPITELIVAFVALIFIKRNAS